MLAVIASRIHHYVAHPNGTYVGVRFSPGTVAALLRYCDEHAIPDPVKGEDFHATVLYSPAPVPYFPAHGPLNAPVSGVGPFAFERFGEEKDVLVMTFRCPWLHRRHALGKSLGGKPTWPDYTPHVTLSYGLPANFDVTGLPSFQGPLEIVEEYMNPLDPDWKKKR